MRKKELKTLGVHRRAKKQGGSWLEKRSQEKVMSECDLVPCLQGIKWEGNVFSQFVSPSVLQFLSHYDEKGRYGPAFSRPNDISLTLTGPSPSSCAISLSFSQSWKHTWKIQRLVSLTGNSSHQTLTMIIPFFQAALLCLWHACYYPHSSLPLKEEDR